LTVQTAEGGCISTYLPVNSREGLLYQVAVEEFFFYPDQPVFRREQVILRTTTAIFLMDHDFAVGAISRYLFLYLLFYV